MHKISKHEFEQLPLQAPAILAGMPLHDVWTVELIHWRPGITLSEFLEAAPLDSMSMSSVARFLMRLRFSIGRIFGWDKGATKRNNVCCSQPDTKGKTTLNREVSTRDCGKCSDEDGKEEEGLRLTYRFANEHIFEVTNKTVHAALAVVLFESGNAYRLYLGVYVAKVSRWTPYYMAAIAPFRRWIVYPALLRGFCAKWDQTYGCKSTRP